MTPSTQRKSGTIRGFLSVTRVGFSEHEKAGTPFLLNLKASFEGSATSSAETSSFLRVRSSGFGGVDAGRTKLVSLPLLLLLLLLPVSRGACVDCGRF
jgi:hypothetical protein